jgi:hypothetical protein
MTFFAVLLTLAAGAIAFAWYGVRLVHMIKSDGYGFRAASGLPRDWSPSVELPSTSYTDRPHH